MVASPSKKIVFILPCYNEEDNLGHVIDQILKYSAYAGHVIVAINDGSSDKTGEILHRLRSKFGQNLIVLDHEKNLGLAEALRTGFLEACRYLNETGGLIITMDADRTHNPKYVDDMLQASKKAGLVIASRYIKGGGQFNVPYYRLILSYGVNSLMRHLFGLKVKDVTSNFRCYQSDVILKMFEKYSGLFIEARGFEVAAELLIKLHKHGCHMIEIPFKLDYRTKRGRSRIKLGKTIFSYLRLIWRMRKW